MTINDVLLHIERLAAPELQEDWDNSGLLTGQRNQSCTGVLLCLDATEAVLQEAAAKGCNLVVAHHPILFKGVKSLTGKNYIEKAIIAAVKKDIAIYAVHTNLDNVILGVNGKMAEMLGLKNTTVLQPKYKVLRRLITFAPLDKAAAIRDTLFAAGAGHIGQYAECSFNSEGTGTFRAEDGANPYVGEVGRRHEEREAKIEIVYPFYLEAQIILALKEAHPYEEVAYDVFTMENVHQGIGAGIIGELEAPEAENAFLQKLRAVFKTGVIKHTALRNKPVQKVALCGGAGSFLTGKALALGADVFITSDVKYHEFFDAEGVMVLADVGHYESEQYTVDLLHDLLVQKIPNFAVLKTSVDTNPVRYFT